MFLRCMMCAVLWMYGVFITSDLVRFAIRCRFVDHCRPVPINDCRAGVTDDRFLAMRNPVTDKFSDHANECYLIQNQTAFTAVKLYILQSHMTLFNILVLIQIKYR
jgi:hypothetical protein